MRDVRMEMAPLMGMSPSECTYEAGQRDRAARREEMRAMKECIKRRTLPGYELVKDLQYKKGV